MRAPALLCVIAAFPAACQSQPDAAAASAAVLAHFEAIAPMAVVRDSFRVIDPAAKGDTVRVRTVWAFTDTSGTWVDTSAVLTARIVRDADAMRVIGYDSMMAAHVFELVDEDRRRRYEDLLDSVHHIYHAIVEAGWYGAPAIDPDSLRSRVERFGHAVDAPWGITAPGAGVAQVIWLADPENAQAMCALPVTAGAGRPQDWEWVADDEFFTCRGRTADVYSRMNLPLEIRDAMRSSGVMPPAPPPEPSRAGSHRHED
jgi:hypothetical protein